MSKKVIGAPDVDALRTLTHGRGSAPGKNKSGRLFPTASLSLSDSAPYKTGHGDDGGYDEQPPQQREEQRQNYCSHDNA